MKRSIIVLLVMALALVVESLKVPPFAESNELQDDESEARSVADNRRVRRQTALDCSTSKPLYPTNESDDDLSSEEEASEDYNPKPRNGCPEVTKDPPATTQSTAQAAAESVDESSIAKEAGNDVTNGVETRVRRAVMKRRRGCKGGRKNRRGRKNKRVPNGHGGFVIVETLEITFDATDCGPAKETPAAPSTKTTLIPSTTTDAPSPATESATATTVDAVDDSIGGPRVRRMARRRRPNCDYRGNRNNRNEGRRPDRRGERYDNSNKKKTTRRPMGGSDTKTSTTETVNQRNLSGALPEESKDDSSSPDGWECAMVRRTSTTGTQTTATTTAPEATKMESSTAISNDDSSTEGTPSRVRRQAAKKPKNVKKPKVNKKPAKKRNSRRRSGRNAPLYRPQNPQASDLNSESLLI